MARVALHGCHGGLVAPAGYGTDVGAAAQGTATPDTIALVGRAGGPEGAGVGGRGLEGRLQLRVTSAGMRLSRRGTGASRLQRNTAGLALETVFSRGAPGSVGLGVSAIITSAADGSGGGHCSFFVLAAHQLQKLHDLKLGGKYVTPALMIIVTNIGLALGMAPFRTRHERLGSGLQLSGAVLVLAMATAIATA